MPTFDWFSTAGRQKANQDAVLPPLQVGDAIWTAIADGVGGASGGSTASRLAIESVAKLAAENLPLSSVFEAARQAILNAATGDLARMATTLTVCRISRGYCDVGHVGDTRLYHLRGFGIQTRTKDQTEAQELLEAGVLRVGEVHRYPRRNVLTSSLNASRPYLFFENSFQIQSGDKLILTTDGVHGVLQKRELRDLALAAPTAGTCVSLIGTEVTKRGPTDDYSAVAVYI